MDLEKVKVNTVDEIVLSKPRLAVTLKFRNGLVQPDRFAQVEPQADFIQRAENLMCARVVTPILNTDIPQHAVVLKNLCP